MANFTFIRARAPLLSPSGLLLLCVLLYIVHCIFSYRKLRKFKGPRTVGYSKIWLLRCVTSGKMHHKFIEISRKYGKHLLNFYLGRVVIKRLDFDRNGLNH